MMIKISGKNSYTYSFQDKIKTIIFMNDKLFKIDILY